MTEALCMITEPETRSTSVLRKALSREGLPTRRVNSHNGGAEGPPGLDLHKATGDGKMTRDTAVITRRGLSARGRWGIK